MTTVEQAVRDAILRKNFKSFLRRCLMTLNPGRPYQPNCHISATGYQLERVRCGESKRLMINLPPRYLKSIMTSIAFPAFVLGHDPTKRIIVVSYAMDLAVKHANDFRAIVNSAWYKRAFPEMRLSRMKDTENGVIAPGADIVWRRRSTGR